MGKTHRRKKNQNNIISKLRIDIFDFGNTYFVLGDQEWNGKEIKSIIRL